jgi:hypothetical protein
VVDKALLRALRWDFGRGFFIHLAKLLEARRGPDRRLELMRQRGILKRLVTWVAYRT